MFITITELYNVYMYAFSLKINENKLKQNNNFS